MMRRVLRSMATLSVPPAPKFAKSANEIRRQTQHAIQKAREALDSIAAGCPDPVRTFATMEDDLSGPSLSLSFYQHVSSDPDVRRESEEAERRFADFKIETLKREDVYEKIASGVPLSSGSLDQRFLEKVLLEFERNGLGIGLSARDKKALENLQKELSDVAIQYLSNIGHDLSFREFTEEQLRGVPHSVLSQLERLPNRKLKVTFKAPELTAILQNCSVESTRKEMWLASENQIPKNSSLFLKALELREKIAHLLGFRNHAELVLTDRMTRTPETVKRFLTDLLERARPLAIKEHEEFTRLKGGPVFAWDSAWIQNKVIEDRYNVDQELVSQYFPTHEVLKRMFGIFSDVMGLKFEELPLDKDHKWHSDVVCYSVFQSSEFRGYLYLDLYPRENKYNHFAMFSLLPGYIDTSGCTQIPASALICNFPSSGTLKHDDVVTLFHELGHGIHSILGVTPYSRFCGTNVVGDFVETPSQLLENWIWDRKLLKRVSCHYQSGEPLPEKLVDRIVASRQANAASRLQRQLFFGLFDLKAHTEPSCSFDPLRHWESSLSEITGLPCPEHHAGYTKFSHLMAGYDAGYYGYLWSMVFSADIWHSLFAKDPLNATAGERYRDIILSRGGSRDEMVMLTELMGRQPSPDSFFKEFHL